MEESKIISFPQVNDMGYGRPTKQVTNCNRLLTKEKLEQFTSKLLGQGQSLFSSKWVFTLGSAVELESQVIFLANSAGCDQLCIDIRVAAQGALTFTLDQVERALDGIFATGTREGKNCSSFGFCPNEGGSLPKFIWHLFRSAFWSIKGVYFL